MRKDIVFKVENSFGLFMAYKIATLDTLCRLKI